MRPSISKILDIVVSLLLVTVLVFILTVGFVSLTYASTTVCIGVDHNVCNTYGAEDDDAPVRESYRVDDTITENYNY